MNYEVMKYIIITIIIITNAIVLKKVKMNNTFKYLFLLISIIFIICLGFSKYQFYATDNINRQYFSVNSYKYNEDKTEVSIEYMNEDNEKVSLKVDAKEININMSNGLGEVEKRKREYKKEILVFNKLQIPLGSIFKNDTDLIVLNQLNFMSEEEKDEYYQYMEQLNNESNENEIDKIDDSKTDDNKIQEDNQDEDVVTTEDN